MLICILRFPVKLSGDCQISSVGNYLPHKCQGVEGVVGELKSVSWGGARTKGEVHKHKLTKNMFLHSDMLKLCLMKKWKINEFFPDTTFFFTIRKLAFLTNVIKR